MDEFEKVSVRCNLLVKLFIIHNYSNFNHTVTMVFSFKICSKIWFDKCRCIWDKDLWSLHYFFSILHDCDIFSKPKSASSKFICAKIVRILTCHSWNIIFRSNREISYFNEAIKYPQIISNNFNNKPNWKMD